MLRLLGFFWATRPQFRRIYEDRMCLFNHAIGPMILTRQDPCPNGAETPAGPDRRQLAAAMRFPSVFPPVTAVAAFAGMLLMPSGAPAQTTATVPSRPGVAVPVLVLEAPRVRATVILLAGGDGILALHRNQPMRLLGNALVRNRLRILDAGLRVVLVDAPSDRQDAGLRNFRTAKAHLQDLQAVLRWAARRWPGQPVWVAGHSRGAVSAAALAAMPPAGSRLDGVILTAPAVRGSRRDGDALPAAPLARIRVPLVIVQHVSDVCPVSRTADVTALAKTMKRVRLIILRQPANGPGRQGHPCRGRSPHGFHGLDAAFVRVIAGAILKAR